MTVINVETDNSTLSLKLTAHFDATPERVWELWEDPRQLERWWGPPMYPATFADFKLVSGEVVKYFMTSPEGDKYHGWWRVGDVAAPNLLSFIDGFGDSDGDPNPDMPESSATVNIVEHAEGGTQMTIDTVYGSLEAMEQVLSMGMVEGITAAVSQIDAILEG